MTHPLTAIREREEQAARRLEAAREQAEQLRLAAVAEADRRLEEARLRGETAADARYEAAVGEARSQAEERRAAARAHAERLPDLAAPHLDAAVADLVAFVLPEGV